MSKFENFTAAIDELTAIYKVDPAKGQALALAVGVEIKHAMQNGSLTEADRAILVRRLDAAFSRSSDAKERFKKSGEALAAWLHGHALKDYSSPLEALQECEINLPVYADLSAGEAAKIKNFIATVRQRLNLPEVIGVFSLAEARTLIEEYDGAIRRGVEPVLPHDQAKELMAYVAKANAVEIDITAIQEQITEALRPLPQESREHILRCIDHVMKLREKDGLQIDANDVTRIFKAQLALDALTAWMAAQGEADKTGIVLKDTELSAGGVKFSNALEALKAVENDIALIPIEEDDKAAISTLLGAVRVQLKLPRIMGVFTVEDAEFHLRLANHGGDYSVGQKRALEEFIERSKNETHVRAEGLRTLSRSFEGFPQNKIKDSLGSDIKRNLTGVYSGQSAMDHLKRLADEMADRDRTLERVKKHCVGRVYFEKFIELIGADRRFLLGTAQRGLWVLSEETRMTHDQVIAGRPKLVGDAHPFFISGKMIDNLDDSEAVRQDRAPNEAKLFQIDQPFKTVWVERSDGGPLFYLAGSKGPAWIIGALVHEESAHSYYAETFVAQKDDRTSEIAFMIYTTKLMPENVFGRIVEGGKITNRFNVGTMIQTATHDVLYWVFKSFRKDCAFATEKVKPIRARVGSGKDRQAIKINKIVRVMLKSERKEYERTAGRHIEWTHKWEVMGHWVTLHNPDTIGKDRDGNYCVRGRTWRSEHVKGKGDLVKKSRVIIEDSDVQ